jgi:hypothetical protein
MDIERETIAAFHTEQRLFLRRNRAIGSDVGGEGEMKGP